jgi:hypothetical protein
MRQHQRWVGGTTPTGPYSRVRLWRNGGDGTVAIVLGVTAFAFDLRLQLLCHRIVLQNVDNAEENDRLLKWKWGRNGGDGSRMDSALGIAKTR